jgi:DNA excision repair protein ERCC-2
MWKESASTLKILCADASWHLRERVRLLASMVAFSATLKPFDFHASLCGFSAELTPRCEFPSPFPKINRKIVAIPQVSTAWKDRKTSTPKIAEILEKIIPLRQGNYFVFFPSYQFLHEVFERVNLSGFDSFAQPRNASHEQIATIRKHLSQNRNVVVFAVQGGSFAEGIDLPGDELIAAIVVGPPLPTFDFEREALKRYYQEKYGSGFQFAYVFPAMAKAVQAAGRVIRTPHDRGLLVLIDRRFLQTDYARCMPADWFAESPQELVSQSILKDIADFWEEDSQK